MMIDSHCHFDAAAFDKDREQMFQRAVKAGVEQIVSPAITAESWENLKRLTSMFAGVHPCYGLHPMFIELHKPYDLLSLEQWIARENPIAVGEIGLDFYRPELDRAKQNRFFEAQLDIAMEARLPVIIHARKAVEPVSKQLRCRNLEGGVLHSYSGSVEQAQPLMDRNFYFGFGGPVTWPRSSRLRRVVASIPLDRILLETDAPDQSGLAHKGHRNEPAYLAEVAQAIADIKGTDIQTVIDQTGKNAQNLFGL